MKPEKGCSVVQGKVERFSLADGEDAVIHELRAPLGAAADALKQFWGALDGEQGTELYRRDIANRLAAREDIGDRWYVATTIEGIVNQFATRLANASFPVDLS